MILLHSRNSQIKVPLVNRCHMPADEKYYLLLYHTCTKDLCILKLYDRVHHQFLKRENRVMIDLDISLPDSFAFGEYEYYLTPDNLFKVILDINNINNIENEVFKKNILNAVFSKNSVIFAYPGDSPIPNTQREGKLFESLRIISSGLLKFNDSISYYEPDSQTKSEYVERK